MQIRSPACPLAAEVHLNGPFTRSYKTHEAALARHLAAGNASALRHMFGARPACCFYHWKLSSWSPQPRFLGAFFLSPTVCFASPPASSLPLWRFALSTSLEWSATASYTRDV